MTLCCRPVFGDVGVRNNVSLLRNIAKVCKEPSIGVEFAGYWASRFANSEQATKRMAGDVKLQGFNGFSEYHSCGAVSPSEEKVLRSLSIDDELVVDVGANLGLVSLMLSKAFPLCEIHAFEPNPSTHTVHFATTSN